METPGTLAKGAHAISMMAMILICMLPAEAKAKPVNARVKFATLRQNSGLFGDVTVFVNPSAVKVQDDFGDWQLLSTAPDWKVVLFDTNRKIYAEKSFKEWQEFGLQTRLVETHAMDHWPVVRLGDTTYAGIKASIFALPYKYSNGRVAHISKGRAATYMAALGIPASAQVVTVLRKLFHMPDAPGIPLHYEYQPSRTDGFGGDFFPATTNTLLTRSTSSAQLESRVLKVPPGLKKVPDAIELIMSKRKKSGFEGWFEDMGIGEDFGSKRHSERSK